MVIYNALSEFIKSFQVVLSLFSSKIFIVLTVLTYILGEAYALFGTIF